MKPSQLRSGLAVAALAVAPAHAAILFNYSTESNDRFQNSDIPDQFILSTFDLSGVGQDANGVWATLIGPNTIIAANHFRPTGSVFFYPDNDPNSAAVELGITGDTQRIGDTDLWLARLSSHAPATITIFDYATQQISQPNSPAGSFPYQNEPVFMTARSPGSFPATQDQAYGTNEISGFLENDTSTNLGTLDVFRLDYDPGDTAFETFAQVQDSGAPLLYNDGSGGLLLLGINSYVTTSNGDPVATYASYVGNESEEIDLLVAQWAAIPEPSLTGMLLIAGAGVLVVRRRH